MREELRKLDRYTEQCRFLCREKLNTAAEVTDFIEQKESILAETIQAREKIYNRLRRCYEPESIETLKTERDALTHDITVIRKQLRLAEAVLSIVPSMKENIREEQRLQAQMYDEIGRYYREREAKKKEYRSRGWER